MKSIYSILSAAAFLLISVANVAAVPITVDWASAVSDVSGFDAPYGASTTSALHAPDGRSAAFVGTNPTATFSNFGRSEHSSVQSQRLSALLGITEATLSEADFIAFEHNGSHSSAFESGTWTFTDGVTTFDIVHDFNNPSTDARSTASGAIANSDYAEYFGFTNPHRFGNIVFLLLDLDGLDLTATDLSVTLAAEGTTRSGVTSPDLDAMGILRGTNNIRIPEPPIFLLLLGALGLMAGIRLLRKD